MRTYLRRLGTITLLTAAACGGGGGGGGGGGQVVTPPSNLDYPDTVSFFVVDVPVTPNTPTYDGSPSTFTVQPALPPGLSLNPQTGSIVGMPTQESARANYTVTASNSAGSTTAVLVQGVALPARFAYVVNQLDSTITVCTVDATTGRLNDIGYHVAPASQSGPERMAVHPNGQFAYVPNQNTSNVSAYSIDPAAGWLTPGNPIAVGSGPHSVAIDPAGTYAYVTSQNSDQLHVFSINGISGALTLVQLLPTGVQPSACTLDPTGRFLFVTLHGVVGTGQQSAIQSYLVDPLNGTVSVTVPAASLNGAQPTDVSVDPHQSAVYVSLERFDFVIPLTFDPVTGALTLGTADISGDRPVAVTVEPTGRFTYVANRNAGSVSCYTVDQTTGDLTPVSTVAAGAGTTALLSDPAGRFVYVLSSGSQNLTQFRIDEVTGGLVAEEGVMTRAAPSHVAFVRGAHPLRYVPRFLHVAAASSDEIPTYTISPASGVLTEVPNPPLTGDRPVSVAADSRHRFLYVANFEGRTIGTFTINSTSGMLASVGASAPTAGRPTHLTIDPSGRFLYVTTRDVINPNDGWVSTWTINQSDGSITQLETDQVANQALWAECEPTGSYLYVASKGTGPGTAVVTPLRISPTTGALTDLGSPLTAPGVVALGFHPHKPTLYAVLNTGNAIATFTIDPVSGDLTVVPGGAGNSGLGPTSIEVTPDGRFAYVSYFDAGGNGHVSAFPVDPVTGRLVAPGVQYSDGLHPNDLALDGSGLSLYVANSGSNDISHFRVDPATGELVLMAPKLSGLEPSALVVTTITE